MKLGILINTDKHAEDLIGLTKAALSKGHHVTAFFMNGGVKLLANPDVNDLCEDPDIEMSYCDYTTQKNGLSKEGFNEKIVCGSQYDNATMNHKADRVIVL
ncbi:MAG: DsrE family protein [Nitrospirota bacterium]